MPFGGDFKKPEFKKISDYVWEIPTSFKQGMRVPAQMYATRKLIDEMDLHVFDQITNVATLPGIVRAAMCMADGHSGYGFPIGGVAAMDVKNGGVISPGGIGFDINCLPPETRVGLANGTWKRIADLEDSWQSEKIESLSLGDTAIKSANAVLFLKRMEDDFLYEITTKSGRKIRATEDHPLLTENGMIESRNISVGDNLHVRPFSGVELEKPSAEIIVKWEDVEKTLDSIEVPSEGNSRKQLRNFLSSKGLEEIRYDSSGLPAILRLMGFIFGDGSISFSGTTKTGGIQFYAKTEDLETIKQDLDSLGLKTQKVYSRKRSHRIDTYYGRSEFEFLETSLYKKSTALAALLVALGTPYGIKTTKNYRVPRWIMKAPLWQKRLFVAAFFGAELSSPKAANKYNFLMPQLNMNKLESLKENAEDFLNDVRTLLLEFGVESSYPVPVEGYQYAGKHGKTVGLRLTVKDKPLNLIRLYESIGFEYNRQKSQLASVTANYLRFKETVKTKRKEARNVALEMYRAGTSPHEIRDKLKSAHVSDHFITHSIWPDRSDDTRVPPGFPSFVEYSKNLIGEGIVLDEIEHIEKVPYRGYVYDFTMNDEDHNFIADGIVVSNCGMRLMRTDLTWKEVEPKLKKLVDLLYERVPAGVGSSSFDDPRGFAKLTPSQFRELIMGGAAWCIEKGYGWKEDLERTEENGTMKGANEAKVSDKAVKRGLEQVGTLGSGNHYLEIQVVKEENIFDQEAAKTLGIFPEQVVIMFHCGSRGFGHQVATDYLQGFLQVMEKKYGIKILDRELACAPFESPEGQDYFAAMKCAINMAFANRQMIAHRIREAFSEVFKKDAEKLGIHQIYDVAHNTAKLEEYKVDGVRKTLLIHRKGATRSLGPGNPHVPKIYQDIGQPVIIGGSMETGSYLLLGTQGAEEQTFGSTAHGSGRTMSRTRAKRMFRGDALAREMMQRGIYVKSVSFSGLAEEAGAAYKDIDEVIDATDKAGISKKVVRLVPVGNVKG